MTLDELRQTATGRFGTLADGRWRKLLLAGVRAQRVAGRSATELARREPLDRSSRPEY